MTEGYKELEGEIRKEVNRWFQEDEIDYLIGYEKGTHPWYSRPVFIDDPSDTDKLVWNPGCVNNLTHFLVEGIKKEAESTIGIMVKPCDSRSLVELMKENIVPRERAKIVGLACEGVIDPEKEEREEELADRCQVCTTREPIIAEVTFGQVEEEKSPDEFEDIEELGKMELGKRAEYWEEELSKCVQCYGCREVCPLCYCEECIFDREKPYKWNEKSSTLANKMFYHISRAMHLAGRCADCRECERACPMDIPLSKINRYLTKRVKERFDVRAGMDLEEESLFTSYEEKDPEEIIW